MAEPTSDGRVVLPAGHPAEREAARAAVPGIAFPVTVHQRTGPALARQAEAPAPTGEAPAPAAAEADSSGSSMMDSVIDQGSIALASVLGHSFPMPVPETVLAALTAAEAAFVARGFRRLVTQGELLKIAGRVRELADARVAVEFGVRYLWGVLKGLASPVTGLVSFAVSGVELAAAAGSWAAEHWQNMPEVEAEAKALAAEWDHFTAAARANLEGLRSQEGALAFAGAVFSAAQSAGAAIERQLVGMARDKGRQAADQLINELLHTPLPELAEKAGEIVGTVIIEVVLLAFSDGIGNLITKLGEFARSLRPLSRGVGLVADVLGVAGRIIADLEHIVGALMSKTVLRPLMPLLEALEPLLARARQFSRRLLGLSEEVAGGLGRAAARTLTRDESRAVGAAEHAVEPPAPKPPTAHRPPRPPVTEHPPGGGGRGGLPVRGATAQGVGEEFRYEYHPEQPTPPVERPHAGPAARPQHAAPSAGPKPEPARPRTSGFTHEDRPPGTGKYDEPLTPEEEGLTPEELRRKHILEDVEGKQEEFHTGAKQEALEERGMKEAKKPGRTPPVHLERGQLAHEYAELLIKESELPRGLTPEVMADLPGGKVRIDRVDFANGIYYEIKPTTQTAAGARQIAKYAEYMNKNFPLGGGKRWVGRVVTYKTGDAVGLFGF